MGCFCSFSRTLTVTSAQVYITGLTAGNKTYDGNKTAVLTGTAVLKRVKGYAEVSGLTVSGIKAEFADKNVGTGKAVTITGGTLSDAVNYTLMPGKTTGLKANITAASVTVSGVAATGRGYKKGDVNVALTGGKLSNVLAGDTVTVDLSGAKGTMADADAGTNKPVTVTGVKLGGAQAGNYTFSAQPTGVTVTISKADLTLTAPKAKSGLLYTGSAQALVEAGKTDDGTMYYAVTTGSSAPAADKYSTSIPTGTNAGTYNVWYKGVGDKNHNNSDPAKLAVTISPVDKSTLNAAISNAEAYYNSIKDNADYKAVAAKLKDAIDAAKAVAANDNAKTSDISGAISSVNTAVSTAKADVQAIQQAAAEEEIEKKKAADQAAAQAVVDAINALPGSAGVDDQAAVEAARKAYDALTDDQKKLVSADMLKRLTAAEEQVYAAVEASKTIDISTCEITVKDVTYTGKKIKKAPAVTVKHGETELTQGTDYTFTYDKKAKKIGAYKLTVTGMGRCVGSAEVTFNIVPKGTSFSNRTGGNKQITLKWKKQTDITGYQIEYAVNNDFSDGKTVKIKKAGTTSKTIKKLKNGTKYYVRIRTYTTVKKKGTFYSAWSKTKTVKTKGKAAKSAALQSLGTIMFVGDELDLKLLLSPEAAESAMTWVSGDENIVTVTEDGVAQALNPGEAIITMVNQDGDEVAIAIRVDAVDTLYLDIDGNGPVFLEIDDDIDSEIIDGLFDEEIDLSDLEIELTEE